MNHVIATYCERQGPGLLEEPVNTLTNLVFIWASIEAWNLAGRNRIRAWDLTLMIGMAAAVGVGSGIWHAFATPWAKPMDLIPILLFQLCFLWIYLRSCGGRSIVTTAVLISVYFVLSLIMYKVPPYLNGSILYAPTFLVLLCIAAYHYATQSNERYLMAIGAGLFCIAIMLRSIDSLMCGYVPFGTHFLWHIFNGGLLYVAMRSVILHRSYSVKIQLTLKGHSDA